MIWTALALVLILEGSLPLLAPRVWRDAFARLLALTDGQLRFVGLLTIGAGGITLAILQYA